jgi:cyanophycin synthetase
LSALPAPGSIALTSLETLGRFGAAGRRAAVTADLLRATGPRPLLERWRIERERRQGSPRLGEDVYDALWREAAKELGAEVASVGDGFLRIYRGGAETLVRRNAVPVDDEVRLRLADDKWLVRGLLSRAGIAVSPSLRFASSDRREAVERVRAGSGTWVVKPAGGTGSGEGVTCKVSDEQQLRRAVLRAARWSQTCLLEQEVPGLVYRVLILDGEVIDIIRRRPPCVVGDGRSTVAGLVGAENRRRVAAGASDVIPLLLIDLDCLFTLASAGLGLRSVLPAGQVAVLKTVNSQNRATDNETVRDAGPALQRDAMAAAAAVGLRLAGVDVVAVDPSRGLADGNGAVLEVNGHPGLHYHYRVAEPDRATRVAETVLERLLTA